MDIDTNNGMFTAVNHNFGMTFHLVEKSFNPDKCNGSVAEMLMVICQPSK